MELSNHVYDILKWVSLIVLPAFATFILLMGDIWGIPYAVEIATTINGFAVFVGACLQISSNNYHQIEEEETLDPEQ